MAGIISMGGPRGVLSAGGGGPLLAGGGGEGGIPRPPGPATGRRRNDGGRAGPDVQRLEGPSAWLLRGRHGGAWWHVGGGLVHPDSDDGGRCHRMDRVSAAG